MTTAPIPDLRTLAEAVKNWSTCNEAWPHAEHFDVAVVGGITEGQQYPLAQIEADTYGTDGESLKLAQFYAAANPSAVLALLDRIAELEVRLVAEARATAEHELRADQLAQQHRMQAQMHAQATQQLAELEVSKNARIHELEMDALGLACENSILKRQDSELEARKPLPPARVDELMAEAGYLRASAESRADFINGLRHGEDAHGITGGSS